MEVYALAVRVARAVDFMWRDVAVETLRRHRGRLVCVTRPYVTRLSIPLFDRPETEVWSQIHASIADDPRVDELWLDAAVAAHGRPAGHATVCVRLFGDSTESARLVAAELHERALRRVVEALGSRRSSGWMSSYSDPELAPA